MPSEEIPPHRDIVNVDEVRADKISVSSIVTEPTDEQIDAEVRSAVFAPSQHHEWIIFNRPAKRLLVAFLACFLMVMFFQSFVIWTDRGARLKQNSTINNQSKALAEQADREREDQKFFDLVGRLIVIGPATTPEATAERKDILDQLEQLRAQHERDAAAANDSATTTTTAPKTTSSVAQGSPAQNTQGPSPPPPSSTTTTTQAPATTTTTSRIPLITLPTLPSIPQTPLPCVSTVLCDGTRGRKFPLSAWVTVWRR